MKAAVLEKINNPLVIEEVELTNLLAGQVLVKVLVSGICGAQLQEIAGYKGNASHVPHLLGHEGCGVVQEVGEGVTKVKKGDKVIMHWRKGGGMESDFPRYIFKGKEITSGKVTTFSEYSIVSENRITSVPKETPNELCALLGCGLSTALGVVYNEAVVMPQESVMIIGAGGLGINLINVAQLAKAGLIIVADIHESKRKLCQSLGIDTYIDIAKDINIQNEIEKKAGVKDIDVIIDTSGNTKSIEKTISLLSGKGRYILVGQPKPGESIEIKNANHLFGGEGKVIKATQGGQFNPTEHIPQYLAFCASGNLNIDGLVTHRVRLDEINDAIDIMKAGQAGRVLIEM